MKKISVVINTKNAANTLSSTLKSVQFADEVIVADMESTDKTVAIAREFGAKIIRLKDIGSVEPEARNAANLEVKSEWTFQVDADEVITSQLQAKILEVIVSQSETTGYEIARKNMIFGQWIQHSGWWPDYQLRVFKTGTLQWTGGVHSKPRIDGTVEKLPATQELAIIHDNYRTVTEYIDRLNRYTTLQAQAIQPSQTNSYIKTLSGEFCRRYFQQEGWQDGQVGLLLSLLQSFYEVVSVAKNDESHHKLLDQKSAVSETDLRQFTKDIHYWLANYHVEIARSNRERIYWRIRRKLTI